MKDDPRTYFRSRAEHELAAGQAADHPQAARAHFLLAGYYFDRAFNPGAQDGEALPA